MMHDKLKMLDKHLKTNENFKEVFEYFLTHFAEREWFMDSNKKEQVPFIRTMVYGGLRHFFQKEKLTLNHFMMFLNKKTGLHHGIAQLEGFHMMYFYSKRVNKGMLHLARLGNEMNHFIRISPDILDTDDPKALDNLLDDDELNVNLN